LLKGNQVIGGKCTNKCGDALGANKERTNCVALSESPFKAGSSYGIFSIVFIFALTLSFF
jgi:hypothetical protein